MLAHQFDYKPRAVEIFPIIEHLAAEIPKRSGTISQNGVKYRTLCERCNSRLLGAEYDKEFIRFVNGISDALKSPIALPKVINFEAKPQRVIRSLLGHIAAQGVGRYQKGSITEPLRDYFLDMALPLPDEMKIYAWVFPYPKHVMARDISIMSTIICDPVVCWLLKFFPVGFLVTFSEPTGYTFPGVELSTWRKLAVDDAINIPFPLRPVPFQHWPEAPSDNGVVLYGKEAITSFKKRNK